MATANVNIVLNNEENSGELSNSSLTSSKSLKIISEQQTKNMTVFNYAVIMSGNLKTKLPWEIIPMIINLIMHTVHLVGFNIYLLEG